MPSFIKSVFDLEDMPDSERPHVALVGRSNVGKSSLVNALAGQSGLARVSAEPGRTQTLNFYELERGYFLVDLPGYGFARGRKGRRELFTKLITDYLQETKHLKLVFVVIDSRVGPTELDLGMLQFLKTAEIPFAVIASKIDKLTNSEAAALKRTLAADHPGLQVFYHTIKDSKGRSQIKEAIEKAIRS